MCINLSCFMYLLNLKRNIELSRGGLFINFLLRKELKNPVELGALEFTLFHLNFEFYLKTFLLI